MRGKDAVNLALVSYAKILEEIKFMYVCMYAVYKAKLILFKMKVNKIPLVKKLTI